MDKLDIVFKNNEPPALNDVNLNKIVDKINENVESANTQQKSLDTAATNITELISKSESATQRLDSIDTNISNLDKKISQKEDKLTFTASGTSLHLTNSVTGRAELGELVQNLINKNAVTLSKYVSNTGEEISNSGWADVTEYIEVEPNTSYIINYAIKQSEFYGGAMYDDSKNFIKLIYFNTNENEIFTTTNSTKYIRMNFKHTYLDNIMLTRGTTAHPYVPSTYEVKSQNADGTLSDSTIITPTTQKAYLDTYDGETNIICDTDVTITYPVSENGKKLMSDLDNEITDSYVTIGDSYDGYAEVKNLIKNEIDTSKYTVRGAGSVTLSGQTYTLTPSGTNKSGDINKVRILNSSYNEVFGAFPKGKSFIMTSNMKYLTIGISGNAYDTKIVYDISKLIIGESYYIDYTISSDSTVNKAIISNVMVNKGTVKQSFVSPTYEVKSCGKNLYWHDTSNDGYWYIGANSKYADNNASYTIIRIKPNTSYCMSYKPTGGWSGSFLDENLVYISGVKGADQIIHSPSNARYFAFNATLKDSNIDYFKTLQLVEGTEVGDYEPYQSSTFTVTSSTDKAYVKTFKDCTNIFTDYDVPLNVRYGADVKSNERISNKGEIALLKLGS